MYLILRRTSLLLYLGLIASLFLLAFLAGPTGVGAKVVLGLLYCSGLLLVAYSLLTESRRAYIWLCFILLFYFIAFVQAAFAPSSASVQSIQYLALAMISLLFTTSMIAARLLMTAETQA